MGETGIFQPLTREDKLTVILYRTGIVMTAAILAIIGYASLEKLSYPDVQTVAPGLSLALILLYISTGISVFSIHLYISRIHRILKILYCTAIAALLLLFIAGKGDISALLANKPYGTLLLLPLSGCIGFITAKEAFCFRLTEGYIIALAMPLFLLILSAAGITAQNISYGFLIIAVLFISFAVRKVFMPLHCDIGDKSAYR